MQFLNGNTEYGLSIYHEVNWCADNLANLGCEPSEKVIECLFTSFNQLVVFFRLWLCCIHKIEKIKIKIKKLQNNFCFYKKFQVLIYVMHNL
jgi:hypothetical protein